MPVNKSRYNKSFEWDGARPRRQSPLSSKDKWRRRFIIAVVIESLIILVLAIALIVVLVRGNDTSSTDSSGEISTSEWQAYENSEAGIRFLHPPSWTVNTDQTTSDLDVDNVEVSVNEDGIDASFRVDVIRNENDNSLKEWVSRFGVKDIETVEDTIDGLAALKAAFTDEETGEEQNVYYVLQDDLVYVIDAYQSATSATLNDTLDQIQDSFTFVTAINEGSAEGTVKTPAPTSTKGSLIVSQVEDDIDLLIQVDDQGEEGTNVYSAEDETVALKGSLAVAASSGTIFGYFGAAGSSSSDGIYQFTVGESTKLTTFVDGVSPDLIQTSVDGTVVGYLEGDITIVDASGKAVTTIESSDDITYFDISPDGTQIAYVEDASGTVTIADLDGTVSDTVELSDENIVEFDWDGKDAFAFIENTSATLSGSAELWYQAGSGSAVQLTEDSFAQSSPSIHPNGKQVAYASGSSSSTSIWIIDIDGDNDTNLVKSTEQTIAGWLFE